MFVQEAQKHFSVKWSLFRPSDGPPQPRLNLKHKQLDIYEYHTTYSNTSKQAPASQYVQVTKGAAVKYEDNTDIMKSK